MAEQLNDGLACKARKWKETLNAKSESIYLLYLTLSRALNVVSLVDGD